jgi:hypothetical protein
LAQIKLQIHPHLIENGVFFAVLFDKQKGHVFSTWPERFSTITHPVEKPPGRSNDGGVHRKTFS